MIRLASTPLENTPLSLSLTPALQLDVLQSSFLTEACNGTALTAMSSGAFANRFGRMLGSFVSPLFASTLGLAFEVTAFEGSSRLLSSLQNPANRADLFSWSGENGLAQAWKNSFVNFGIMRSMGHFLRSQQVLFQHLVQDFAVVAGHQTTAFLEWTPSSHESFLSQMLSAEAMNWQFSAGGKLTAFLSGHRLQGVEQNMERGIVLRGTSEFYNRAWRMAASDADPHMRLARTREFIKGGALTRMKEGLRGESPEEYIEAIRIQFLTNIDALPKKAALDLVEWLASDAPVEAPCIAPALTVLKSLCAGSRSFLGHVVGNEAKSQAQGGLLKARARFYAASSPHMDRINEIFRAFGMEIPNDALSHTYVSLDQMIAGLPATREGTRRRIYLELFRSENMQFQEISLRDRKALEAAWGRIPEAFERFINEYPGAAALKVYRFNFPKQFKNERTFKALAFMSILASVYVARLGFSENALYSNNHLDFLPDEFNFFLLENHFTQNPFKPELVDHAIDGRTVRRMRRSHAYPVYDGMDPIFIHTDEGEAQEARDHDWAHILMLAGYSREYVDDIMTFYDAASDYLEKKGENPHPNGTAEIYEGNLDILLEHDCKEDYVLTFEKILEIFPPFFYALKQDRPGPLIVDPEFPQIYKHFLQRYFPVGHPRHALIMQAWDQACRDFQSREVAEEEGLMQWLVEELSD